MLELMQKHIRLILLTFLFATHSNLLAASEFENAAESYRNNDYAVALPAFTKLAHEGDARAQTVLALMHKYGEGTPEDALTAFNWYQRAAELDYPPAQFNLGLMYQSGLGTQKNDTQALEWYKRAAAAGFERANEKLQALSSTKVSSSVVVDRKTPWPETLNFRLPNSQRLARQDRHEDSGTSAVHKVVDPMLKEYRVQLGAMSTLTAAESLWSQLVALSPKLFINQQKFIEHSKSNTNVIYRLQTGPFHNALDANNFCKNFKQISIKTGCLPLLSKRLSTRVSTRQ